MTGLEAWLGLASALNPLAPSEGIGKTGGLVLRDVLLILGSLLVVTILLLLWARGYVRNAKRSKRRRIHRSQQSLSPPPPPAPMAAGDAGTADAGFASEPQIRPHRHRRRRRRRREHRSRNPTLADAGGLPPTRSEPSSPSVP